MLPHLGTAKYTNQHSHLSESSRRTTTMDKIYAISLSHTGYIGVSIMEMITGTIVSGDATGNQARSSIPNEPDR